MTLALADFTLNLLIIGLLAATIIYCRVLNGRIKILQDSKSELAGLLQYFDESTKRASETIIALQTASKKISDNIEARTEKVNYLIDDLAFMIEKGNRLADRLDANFAVDRARSRVLSEDNNVQILPTKSIEREDEEERSLPSSAEKNQEKISAKEKTAISLESVLDRVIGRNKTVSVKDVDNEKSANTKKNSQASRSKAEKELLELIRAGIKG